MREGFFLEKMGVLEKGTLKKGAVLENGCVRREGRVREWVC